MNCDTNNYESSSCSFIKDTVSKIDKIQKEVISDTTGRCIACEASLFTSANNTIPVRFTCCCGTPFEALIGVTGATTSFFRIESVRCNRFVTLRLLEATGEAPSLTGTDYTVILDLDCVGTIQCFEPISVEVCTTSTTE